VGSVLLTLGNMAKPTTYYLCSSCGKQESKWLGRCPECGAWNSFSEAHYDQKHSKSHSTAAQQPKAVILSEVDLAQAQRLDSGIPEVNQALGGGLVAGSVILLGGEPGIGKSTLTLQIMDKILTSSSVLLVAGEESPAQVRLRADRLGIKRKNLLILDETRVAMIETVLNTEKPGLVVIDSIQTLKSEEAGNIPGTVNQLKYCAYELSEWARTHRVPMIFIAHVTKGGLIAGPKIIEHMVDAVLQFEEAEGGLRILRALKNRFGSVDEVGIFRMDSGGLTEVENPAEVFLQTRGGIPPIGSTAAPMIEGSRILLLEIQALAVPAKGGLGRVYSERIDPARVTRVAAVVEKHLGIRFTDQDIYVNVGGGMKISETGVDLPLALALISARLGKALPKGTVSAGELSLAGELRRVPHLRRRLRASLDLGFSHFFGPPLEPGGPKETAATELINLVDAASKVFPSTEE